MTKTAFLFPGQGSQSVGMLAQLALQTASVGDTFKEASEVLGYDLWAVVQGGPEQELNQTEITQPAMLAAGVACWRAWRSLGGPVPDYMAGHSLGEYSALVAAGSLDFENAVKLVNERARLMQSATPSGSGAMAAILGLEETALIEVCARSAQGQVVSCANFNSPGQVVIAGDRAAVERACEQAVAAGAKRAVALAVSVPSHCALMRPAAAEFAHFLAATEFSSGAIRVLHNVDAQAHPGAPAKRAMLEQQLWQPVRWSETIGALAAAGVGRFAECGPGKVLAGLNRRIVREADTVALADLAVMTETLAKWS
jgi:[acyl-carrier-protein] S-malonyltransferase